MFRVEIVVSEFWNNGGNAVLSITNVGSSDLSTWKLNLEPSNFTIGYFWNFNYDEARGIVTPKDWNQKIKAGATIKSGFNFGGKTRDLKYVLGEQAAQVAVPVPAEPTVPAVPVVPPAHIVVGYFTEWSIYQRQFSVNMIPFDKLTHVVYAFTLPNPSQTDYNKLKANYPFPPLPYSAPPNPPEASLVHHDGYAASQSIPLLKEAKKKYPHLKVLVSIGGWSLSWTFSKIMKDPVLRKNLIDSAVKFVVDNGFDGIDIDWEYPGKQGAGYNSVDEANDGKNYLDFLKDLRLAVSKTGKAFQITAATGCNPVVIKQYTGSAQFFDYLFLMSYDYTSGSWDQNGGNFAGLYYNPDSKISKDFCGDSAVKNAMLAGFPPQKIVLGAPLYGRGWSNMVPDDPSKPLFGTGNGPSKTLSGSYGESGMSSFRDIKKAVDDGFFKEYTDLEGVGAYCARAEATGANSLTVWSYDNEETMRMKVQYIKDMSLGGIMFWELSDDVRDGEGSLIDAVVDEFKKVYPGDPVGPVEPVEPPVEPPVLPPPKVDPEPEVKIDEPSEPAVPIVEEPEDGGDGSGSLRVEIINDSSTDVVIKPGERLVFVVNR